MHSILSLVAILVMQGIPHIQLQHVAVTARMNAYPEQLIASVKQDYPPIYERVAGRMQKRLLQRYDVRIPAAYLIPLIDERMDMLASLVHVRFMPQADSNKNTILWDASVAAHPDWVRFSMHAFTPSFAFSKDAIRASLQNDLPSLLPPPESAMLEDIKDAYSVLRGTVVGKPHDGYVYDIEKTINDIFKGLSDSASVVSIPVQFETATLYVQGEHGLMPLTRLSTGRSNFRNSPWGRIANIKKATEVQLHGVYIPPRSVFSFNQTLKGAGRWEDAYVIVNGRDLKLEPGGGICQAATTVYRAILLAGMPVLKQKNHSLYVTYYEKYGVGVDATVYSGKQDLEFENDSDSPIVILGNVEGNEVAIEFFGIDDGREVSMEGPYMADTTPAFLVRDRALRSNEIAWQHIVQMADGTIRRNTLLSTYTAIPRKRLSQEYPVTRDVAELMGTYVAVSSGAILPLHAAADIAD